MKPQSILNSISDLPRIQLARKNTPFEEMPRLRAAIAESMDAELDAVPQLFIKREDTTGFAFGGNKARHMEFLFAHFIERGIDTIVNINHYDSNNARFVAASCAKTGMKYHWVAHDMLDAPVTGNMLIAQLAGAQIHRVPDQPTAKALAEKINTQENRKSNNSTIVSQTPYSDIAGMIAFLESAAELDTQISNYQPNERIPSPSMGEGQGEGERGGRRAGVAPARGGNVRRTKGARESSPSRSVRGREASEARPQGMPGEDGRKPLSPNSPIHIWGLCGRSIGGIRLYARNTDKPWTATAVAQQLEFPKTYEGIYLDRSDRVAHLLGLDTALKPGDITTLAGYTGTYGYTTEAAIAAIHLVASTEGIILDPNYTAKSMAGLIDQIQNRNIDPQTPIIFIHTGGQPQTFAFANELADELWGTGKPADTPRRSGESRNPEGWVAPAVRGKCPKDKGGAASPVRPCTLRSPRSRPFRWTKGANGVLTRLNAGLGLNSCGCENALEFAAPRLGRGAKLMREDRGCNQQLRRLGR